SKRRWCRSRRRCAVAWGSGAGSQSVGRLGDWPVSNARVRACQVSVSWKKTSGVKRSSKRPTGGLGPWSDVFHGTTVASRAPNRRHAPPICTPELARANGHINDRFIDQPLFTADRAALVVSLRRRATGCVQAFRRDRLVALATHTSLSSWLPTHHR